MKLRLKVFPVPRTVANYRPIFLGGAFCTFNSEQYISQIKVLSVCSSDLIIKCTTNCFNSCFIQYKSDIRKNKKNVTELQYRSVICNLLLYYKHCASIK